MFLQAATNALIGYRASRELHHSALKRVLHAPMSFFETQPAGRILSRLSKVPGRS